MTTDTIAPAPAPLTRLSEEEDLFRASVRAFAEAEIAPLAREMDEQAVIPRALIDKLFDLGVMGIEIPESLGGAGAPFFLSVLAVEELSRVDPSGRGGRRRPEHPRHQRPAPLGLVRPAEAVPAPPRGAARSAPTPCPRPAPAADAFALRTRAVEDGNDYVITGRKLWITNAREAGLFIVMASVDPDAGHRGITAFVVEHDRPRPRRRQEGGQAGHPGQQHVRAALLDGCRVPKSHVLGERGKGYKVSHRDL